MEQTFVFIPKGVCSEKISIVYDGDIVKSVVFTRGCPGNTVGVGRLCQNRSFDELIPLLEGIPCRNKPTSCPDQLAQALKIIRDQKN